MKTNKTSTAITTTVPATTTHASIALTPVQKQNVRKANFNNIIRTLFIFALAIVCFIIPFKIINDYETENYTIKSGDTIIGLSKQYEDPSQAYSDILWINGMTEYSVDRIWAGEELLLPVYPEVTPLRVFGYICYGLLIAFAGYSTLAIVISHYRKENKTNECKSTLKTAKQVRSSAKADVESLAITYASLNKAYHKIASIANHTPNEEIYHCLNTMEVLLTDTASALDHAKSALEIQKQAEREEKRLQTQKRRDALMDELTSF